MEHVSRHGHKFHSMFLCSCDHKSSFSFNPKYKLTFFWLRTSPFGGCWACAVQHNEIKRRIALYDEDGWERESWRTAASQDNEYTNKEEKKQGGHSSRVEPNCPPVALQSNTSTILCFDCLVHDWLLQLKSTRLALKLAPWRGSSLVFMTRHKSCVHQRVKRQTSRA